MTMEIGPIQTEADYKAALCEVSALMESDPALGTPDGDRLDLLTTFIQTYEVECYPVNRASPDRCHSLPRGSDGLTVKNLDS